MDGGSAAGTRRESDGAQLHSFANHFLHGIQFLSVRFSGIGGLAHDCQPNRGVRHQRGDVDGDFTFNIVQIVAEGIPFPILVVDVFIQNAP